jgi:hypothetical protein
LSHPSAMPVKMVRTSPCGSPFANRRHSLASSRKFTTPARTSACQIDTSLVGKNVFFSEVRDVSVG